jgi:hypothetical protein
MDESALDALRRAAPSAIALSVTALVHHQNIIHSIGEPIYETPDLRRDKTADYPLDIHPLLLTETDAQLSDPMHIVRRRYLHQRRNEAWLVNVSQFLEHCCSSTVPYKASETLSTIAAFEPKDSIHKTHQRRFARALQSLASQTEVQSGLELVEQLVSSKLFAAYCQSSEDITNSVLASPLSGYEAPETLPPFKYLDDPEASGIIINMLELLAKTTPAQSNISHRAQRIICVLKNMN